MQNENFYKKIQVKNSCFVKTFGIQLLFFSVGKSLYLLSKPKTGLFAKSPNNGKISNLNESLEQDISF